MPTLPIQPVDAPLYVIAAIVNPSRYRSRYSLYRDFEKYITDAGAVLYTVEAAYGDRDFEITTAGNPRHIRLRTSHEVWHKENLINIGVSRLPPDWKYVAWIDADVQFARPDIVAETIHQLQHFRVVQMFAHATDLGPRHEPLRSFEGFVAHWMRQNDALRSGPGHSGTGHSETGHSETGHTGTGRYSAWHPGYAWACRRDAWDHLGGLIDFAIVGSADRYMACGLIGDIGQSLSADIVRDCPAYTEWCFEWQARAETTIKHDIGFVDGLLLHYFHGAKRNRGYTDRSAILWKNQFDPARDIKRDWQGLWQLSGRKIGLRDQLRAYFRSRDEDSTEV
jgi:hypothetical protein